MDNDCHKVGTNTSKTGSWVLAIKHADCGFSGDGYGSRSSGIGGWNMGHGWDSSINH